jgi:hypothetical protein
MQARRRQGARTVDAAVRAVGAPPLLLRLVHLDVLDVHVVGVQALHLRGRRRARQPQGPAPWRGCTQRADLATPPGPVTPPTSSGAKQPA